MESITELIEWFEARQSKIKELENSMETIELSGIISYEIMVELENSTHESLSLDKDILLKAIAQQINKINSEVSLKTPLLSKITALIESES